MSVNRRWILINSISILLHLCHPVHSAIQGPSQIQGFVGGNATFMWNTTDGQNILSATWGLRNGEMANPQFINVHAINYKPSLNLNMPEQYVGRVQFIGDLRAGHAWFMIKNLTIQDSKEYTARISDGEVGRLSSYHVRLVVKNSTEDSAPTPTQPSSIVTSSSKTNITSDVTKDSAPTPTQPASNVTSSSKTNITSHVTTPRAQPTPSSKASTSFCTLGIIFIIITGYAVL